MLSLSLHFLAVFHTHDHRSLLETLIVTCDDTMSAHGRRLSVNMCIYDRQRGKTALRLETLSEIISASPHHVVHASALRMHACYVFRHPSETLASDLESLPWRCTVAALCSGRKGQTHRTHLPTGANSSVIY